jgi:hypothetical protein
VVPITAKMAAPSSVWSRRTASGSNRCTSSCSNMLAATPSPRMTAPDCQIGCMVTDIIIGLRPVEVGAIGQMNAACICGFPPDALPCSLAPPVSLRWSPTTTQAEGPPDRKAENAISAARSSAVGLCGHQPQTRHRTASDALLPGRIAMV